MQSLQQTETGDNRSIEYDDYNENEAKDKIRSRRSLNKLEQRALDNEIANERRAIIEK